MALRPGVRPLAGAMATWMVVSWGVGAGAAWALGVAVASLPGWILASAVTIWGAALLPDGPSDRHAVGAAFVATLAAGLATVAVVDGLTLGAVAVIGVESLALAAMLGPVGGTWRRGLLLGGIFRFLLSGLDLAIRGALG